MTFGPGKYDDLCTRAREKAKAAAALLLIIDGKRGSGFSMQVDALVHGVVLDAVPNILRGLADQIEKDARAARKAQN